MARNSKRFNASQDNERKQRTTAKAERSPREKQAHHRKVLYWVGTLVLVAALTITIFAGIFMAYINRTMKGNVEVKLNQYEANVSSELYYKDPKSDEWVMYQTLFLKGENRIWVDLDDIPENLRNAAIAIEDKRFNSHKGVDWKGTMRAIVSTVGGGSVQGGSTITQQTVKNVTGDNQDTVKRKITEIYRALQLEKDYTKEEILETYLNYIYMGESCYGVKTASQKYFGKDVSELDLAECASLIAITNNPSQFDPLISDWTREQNRIRQTTTLQAMFDQGLITEKEFNKAMNEEIVYTNGYTCLNNYVEGHLDEGKVEEEDVEATNSYFTDAVIEDVIHALMEKYGYTRSTAENKLFSGYKVYTTQNIEFQQIAEDVFKNTDFAGYKDYNGKSLQAAITLMDPYTGEVLAMVGGTGIKTADRSWNWATNVRQCGSAIKPISTYAPALDNGTITAASALDDYPILMNGSAYPKNSHAGFSGMVSVQRAIAASLNTTAVRTNMAYGVTKSYNFMTENLGFTTLTSTDAQQVGNMALGGLSNGVTTEEMAAAYSAFVNDGVYTAPHTFSKVEDSDGNVILDNTPKTNVAMKESTAYLMRNMLQGVVTGGTGTEAYFSGMNIGGKTGTTDNNHDRYFVGFTPYYCAAVWCGYETNETIGIGGNPCAVLWRQVMSRVHEGLANKSFSSSSNLRTVTVCSDSGLLATDACRHDLRGNRCRTVLVAADTAPTAACNMHKMVSYCKDGKHIATEFCPEDSVEDVAVLDYDRAIIGKIQAADHKYLLSTLSEKDLCPAHKTAPEPEEPEKPEKEENSKVPDTPTTPEAPTTHETPTQPSDSTTQQDTTPTE